MLLKLREYKIICIVVLGGVTGEIFVIVLFRQTRGVILALQWGWDKLQLRQTNLH